MFDDVQNARALHEVINDVLWNCKLQIDGIDVGIPFICGAPGGGKTASIHQLSKEYNFGVVSTHLALKPLEETGGIPQFENIIINQKPVLGTIWSFPDIMKVLYEMSELKKDSMVIWFLDDSHLLSPMHMALLYELFTERSLRGYKIPDNCAMVMAGNTSVKSGAKVLFSAIINRCVIMPVYTDFNGWKNNFALKEDKKIHPAVLSFLGNTQYQKFFHEEEQVNTPWGSPRSWTRFSNELLVREKITKKIVNTSTCLYLGTGYVGKEGASEFVTYYKVFTEFDIVDIVANYESYTLPDEIVKKYALSYALTTYYFGKSDRDKITSNVSHLIGLFMKEAPELAVMIIKEIRQFEKSQNKKNILNKLIFNLQKTEPTLTRNLLKDIVDITTDSGN
ncbi:MAG: hypothetical protein PHD05_00665 [Sphaerochaetaceae bacterium]|nr:hypothetical protein [Sphaerochaetaceae bacterium]